jgi:hypothetical protein
VNKSVNILKALSILILVICLLSGCWSSHDGTYHGEYPELFSVAINSILGTAGYGSDGELVFDSAIGLVEEDSYGRILFIYYECNEISQYSLVICQKSDDNYAYFYPDYNFISISIEEYLYDYEVLEAVDSFPVDEIEELKTKNDWGMEISESKCMKVEIVRKKPVNRSVNNDTLRELYNLALGKDAYGHVSSYTTFFITDDYNRSIYVGTGKVSSGRYVVMLFQPDGSYDESKCFFVSTDPDNYQDDLKQLKELNDWNKPLAPADPESSEPPRMPPRIF